MYFKEKYDYFLTLEKLGDFACQEAELLVEILKGFDPTTLMQKVDEMHAIENAADQLMHELFTHVATEFLTPIEREDIASIAYRLDDIVDYIDDVVHQLYMYDVKKIYEPTFAMADVIVKATAALSEALKEFRNFKKSKTLSEKIIVVNDLEDEADELFFRTVRELYTNYADSPVFIMAWNNIFIHMERCIDACESATDIMAAVALKNS
ncbi:MAG: DUF47 family protein [Coriobacteriia bacterium]|nr:DUF47 family protein [Coriobacteriia bacterium]